METGTALERAANDVDPFAISMHRNRDANAAVVLRQRVDLLPRLAEVHRFVERGAVRSLWRTTSAASSAAEAPAGALRRSEDHVRHIERVLDVARAVRVLRTQRVLPGLAAVGRAVDPSAVVLRVTLRRHYNYVRVFWINDHFVDLSRLFEADVRPGLAGIDRFVHAVAG